jgi:hypothetical protein
MADFRLAVAMLLLASSACAEVELQLSGASSYTRGNVIVFTALVRNTGSEAQTITLTSSVRSDTAAAETGPVAYPLTLAAGASNATVVYSKPADELLDGRYTVSAAVYGEGMVIAQKKAEFTVAGVAKDPTYRLMFCRDEACSQEDSYAIVGRPLWLIVRTAEPLQSRADVAQPDGAASSLTLPGKVVPAARGTLTVELSVRGGGFRDTGETVRFPVVDVEPDIAPHQTCDEDGACGSGENSVNCPQDCPEKILPQKKPAIMPEEKGCIPLLTAILAGLAAAIGKTLRL